MKPPSNPHIGLLWLLCLLGFAGATLPASAADATEVQNTSLEFAGHRVHYEVRGNADRTLLFVHGWSSGIASWKYQLDAFPDYKVVALDLPGHGKSGQDESGDYTVNVFAETVHALMQQEEIESAFLLGHSLGFAISEVVCLKYPGDCVGLGSIDGAHFELPDDEQGRLDWLAYNRMFAASMDAETGRDQFLEALFLPDTPQLLKDEVFAIVRSVPLAIGQSIIRSMEDDMTFWEKRVVDIPVVAIHSPVYELTEAYRLDFLKMYPQAEYIELEGVSHFLMLEQPYRINQILHDYLERHYE